MGSGGAHLMLQVAGLEGRAQQCREVAWESVLATACWEAWVAGMAQAQRGAR